MASEPVDIDVAEFPFLEEIATELSVGVRDLTLACVRVMQTTFDDDPTAARNAFRELAGRPLDTAVLRSLLATWLSARAAAGRTHLRRRSSDAGLATQRGYGMDAGRYTVPADFADLPDELRSVFET